MAKRGKLFVVSGPSGVGKGTICNLLRQKNPSIRVSVSCATRAPRIGEVDGRDYFFVTDERFDEMILKGELLEYAQVHSNRYGTPRAYVEKTLSEGFDVILEIDVQGGRQVMAAQMEMTGVFVLPPSYKVLETRLKGRETESAAQIALRLHNAKRELRAAEEYEFLLINDNLDEAVDKLGAIIQSQHLELSAQREHLLRLYDEFEEVE